MLILGVYYKCSETKVRCFNKTSETGPHYNYVVPIQHSRVILDIVATKVFQVVWYQICAMQPSSYLKDGYF